MNICRAVPGSVRLHPSNPNLDSEHEKYYTDVQYVPFLVPRIIN